MEFSSRNGAHLKLVDDYIRNICISPKRCLKTPSLVLSCPGSMVGSLEFCTGKLGARMILVLGHTKCGAVTWLQTSIRLYICLYILLQKEHIASIVCTSKSINKQIHKNRTSFFQKLDPLLIQQQSGKANGLKRGGVEPIAATWMDQWDFPVTSWVG